MPTVKIDRSKKTILFNDIQIEIDFVRQKKFAEEFIKNAPSNTLKKITKEIDDIIKRGDDYTELVHFRSMIKTIRHI